MADQTIQEKKTTATTRKQTARKFTDDTEVTLISNVQGNLFYRNNSNDDWIWGEHGDEHEFSIKELKRMKAQQVSFFSNQWVLFAEKDWDAIKHLKLEKYYENVVFPEDIDDLFDKSPEAFAETLDKSTESVKALILAKAREKYAAKELVNAHIIRIIEERLNTIVDVENPR